MLIKPVKTRKFRPPRDDLEEFLASSLPRLGENTVVAVASKIVSIGEGRCVPKDKVKNKDDLIIQESDKYLPRDQVPGRWVMHTLKDDIFMPSAGIDESNANGHYILWPKNTLESARRIGRFLRRKYRLKNLGVIITDSHSIPLRRGVVGLALAHWGFEPLRSYRGQRDIFGKEMFFSQTNLPDGLAAAAVLVMGEGNEQTPLAVITDVPFIGFNTDRQRSRGGFSDLVVKPEEDLYRPFIYSAKWRRGGGGSKNIP